MPLIWSQEALDRPKRTIEATKLLSSRAPDIARLCEHAQPNDIVVAVINPDIVFGGAWTIPIEHLHERVSRLPAGGWSFTFSPQTTDEQIQARCRQLARLAQRRWEILKAVVSGQ